MEPVVWEGTKFYFCPSTGYYQRRDGRAMHRVVWETINGPIPLGHQIHHLDGTRTNNQPENLVLLTISEHRRIHSGPKATEWHRSEEGREWHRQHGLEGWENRLPTLSRCSICGEAYLTYFKSRSIFCSRKCKARAFRKRRKLTV
jgi:hypothetical protein